MIKFVATDIDGSILCKTKKFKPGLVACIEELKKHDILTEQSYNAIESRYTHITAHIDKKDTYVLRLKDDDDNHFWKTRKGTRR